MNAPAKTRKPVDPTGRLDVAVVSVAVRLLDRLLERYLPGARNIVTVDERKLRAFVAPQLGPRNRKARFVRDVVREVLPAVRRVHQ